MSNTIKIKNFNLHKFSKLMGQSLMVNNQLMFEINEGVLRSCSISQSKAFIKLWAIPLHKLVYLPSKNETLSEDENQAIINEEIENLSKIEKFNFYFLRGENFQKQISLYGTEKVDIEFKIIKNPEDNSYSGTSISISGKTTQGTELRINLPLTTDELISAKISDYSEIHKKCTPTEDMFSFILNENEMKEIQTMTKTLHKAISDNTVYVTISLTKETIAIKDKVFNIDFPLLLDENTRKQWDSEPKPIEFNILKGDFLLAGIHNLSIYTNALEQRVIFITKYSDAVMWCLATKSGNSMEEEEETYLNSDNSILADELAAYLGED